jgi:small subunit ribosomal protein S20
LHEPERRVGSSISNPDLISRFAAKVLDDQALLLIRGRCSSYNTGLPCVKSSTGSHFSTEITAKDLGTAIRRNPRGCAYFRCRLQQKDYQTGQYRVGARQAVQLNAHNSSLRSKLRTAIKSVRKAIATGDKAAASNQFRASMSIIDTIADKRIIHKNAAARHKSRLAAAVKGMETPAS